MQVLTGEEKLYNKLNIGKYTSVEYRSYECTSIFPITVCQD